MRGTSAATRIAPIATTTAKSVARITSGASTVNTTSLKARRSSRSGTATISAKGRRTRPSGKRRRPNSRPKASRNGSVSRWITSLFTCGVLQEFRRPELVGRAARRVGREIRHRLVADPLVQALHHQRLAAGRPLQLREADDDAEADEEREDENGARAEPFQRADRDVDDVAAHASASPCG